MKKNIGIAACLFFFCVRGIFAGTQGALLWVPKQGAQITEELSAIEENPGLRVAIAVSPSSLSIEEIEKLKKLSADGQIEIVLRPDGDLVFPVLFTPSADAVKWRGKKKISLWSSRLDIAGQVLLQQANLFERNFGFPPYGLMPSAGGIADGLDQAAKVCFIEWSAVGQKSDGDFAITRTDSGLILAPFARIQSAQDAARIISALSEEQKPFFVIDESLPPYSDDNLFIKILSESYELGAVELKTPQEIISESGVSYPPTQGFPPPWTGDYGLWAGNKNQHNAYRAIDDAFMVYAGINMRTADRAIRQNLPGAYSYILRACAGGIFLSLGSEDKQASAAAEKEFKSYLSGAYKLMKKPVPPELLRPFMRGYNANSAENSAQIEERNSSIKFANPDGNGYLSSLSVSWDRENIYFTLYSENYSLLPAGNFIAGIYIDLNHRYRSGNVSLIRTPDFSAGDKDGWEYAVISDGTAAHIFAGLLPDIKEKAVCKVSLGQNTHKITVPRSVLPGDAKLWGYLAVLQRKDNAASARNIFIPETNDGKTVIDALYLDKIDKAVSFIRLPRKEK